MVVRKAVIVLVLGGLLGAAVCYAVRRFPRLSTEPQPGRDTTAGTGPTSGLGEIRRVPDARIEPRGRAALGCGNRCGVQRWAVKTLSDAQRSLVPLLPLAATVEELVRLPRPLARSGAMRAAPVELTVYEVKARLVSVIGERDRDWHLILRGLREAGATLIAEVPDPECAGACESGFAQHFAEVRDRVTAWLQDPASRPEPRVKVMGVGFFDSEHGQYGAAPNNFELHPVLWIEFQER